jgi:hypothetical protein
VEISWTTVDKAVTPATKITFLGVTFDSEKMTLGSQTRQGGRHFAAGRILVKKEKNHL